MPGQECGLLFSLIFCVRFYVGEIKRRMRASNFRNIRDDQELSLLG